MLTLNSEEAKMRNFVIFEEFRTTGRKVENTQVLEG